MPTKSSTLSLVAEESEQQEETPSTPAEEMVSLSSQALQSLLERVASLEARLQQVERTTLQLAQANYQMVLGTDELNAIGNALLPHIEQQLFALLKEHYGMAPPAKRGA